MIRPAHKDCFLVVDLDTQGNYIRVTTKRFNDGINNVWPIMRASDFSAAEFEVTNWLANGLRFYQTPARYVRIAWLNRFKSPANPTVVCYHRERLLIPGKDYNQQEQFGVIFHNYLGLRVMDINWSSRKSGIKRLELVKTMYATSSAICKVTGERNKRQMYGRCSASQMMLKD
ncbi:hypothetical protein GJ496_006258 [Pomphorhynchus laevis]|nr:hypothetical protein GJ496_006258 [Pomphorhynchus laevis]